MDRQNKTRTELLQEKITLITNKIEELKIHSKNESNNIELLKSLNSKLNKIKQELDNLNKEEEKLIEKELKEYHSNGLLLINNEKIKLEIENQKQLNKNNDLLEEMKKLKENIIFHKIEIKELNKHNNELIELNSLKDDQINKMKARAYGYDIAGSYEKHNLVNEMNNNMKLNNDNLANNLWDQDNIGYNKRTKLDEFVKEKQMWIGNSNNNLEKLNNNVTLSTNKGMNMNNNTNSNSNIYNSSNNNLNTNMRKYSPNIINHK